MCWSVGHLPPGQVSPRTTPPPDNNPRTSPPPISRRTIPPDNSPPANNFCESWNHSFSKLVGHARPLLYVLVSSLQDDESTASITGYVAVISLVIPASTAVTHASFSSLYTYM